MDNATMKKALHAYVDAFNANDIERLIALFSDEASVEDPVGTPPKTGRKEVEAFYKESISGARLELLAPPRGSYRNAAAITFAVHTEKEGQPIRIDVTDVMTFDSNGKIATMHAYWGPDDIQQL
ncbi:steroid Delta-isomerase [Oceanobacillus oncorhynchi subsp. incaldanensis]|uniref:Steroid Delta-isomerase n=2 Tax=Oceanobacillus TaxID=182709 RepID=A0A0A1MPJ2_9BACI|nr:nuclear transport factor 2 family protein [Oceanobacillus oncorhynchi]MDM8102405.1 nuclear transport factor 2 family protein [Oceanobacillus oncorhynchi]UUI39377.1 nuclear transport factor 2 family protein [Oceanobacillus oncorhynchi]GIO19536.1 steroid Delta-isomerase [Oceanobacillus oncorhynchi subsp. incaldanensis]CEI80991.1 Steroid Delta-isomerase [Oceanobacillus oncorhynchi]